MLEGFLKGVLKGCLEGSPAFNWVQRLTDLIPILPF